MEVFIYIVSKISIKYVSNCRLETGVHCQTINACLVMNNSNYRILHILLYMYILIFI